MPYWIRFTLRDEELANRARQALLAQSITAYVVGRNNNIVEIGQHTREQAQAIINQIRFENQPAPAPTARQLRHGRTGGPRLEPDAPLVQTENMESLRRYLVDTQKSADNVFGKLTMKRQLKLLGSRLQEIDGEETWLRSVVDANGVMLHQQSFELGLPADEPEVCTTDVWAEIRRLHIKQRKKKQEPGVFVITKEAALASLGMYQYTRESIQSSYNSLAEQLKNLPDITDPVELFIETLRRMTGYTEFSVTTTPTPTIVGKTTEVTLSGISMGSYLVKVDLHDRDVYVDGGNFHQGGKNHPHIYQSRP